MTGRKLITDSLALLSLEVVSKAFPLISLPIVARALGPAIYGKVVYAISLAGFFGLMVSSGFATYGTKEVAQNPERACSIVAQLMGARLFFATLAYSLLLIFTCTLAPADTMTRTLILCAGLGLFVSGLDLQWFYAGLSRMWMIAFAGISSQVTNIALTVSLIHGPDDGIRLALITALSPAAAGLFLIVTTRGCGMLPRPAMRPRNWARILPACAMLSLAGIMSQIYDQLDLLLLRYFRSDYEVGMYAAACRVMGLVLSFILFIGQVYFPLICHAAKGEGARERHYLQSMWNITVAIAFPLSIIGMIFARPLTLLILGPQYSEAIPLVRWLMPNVVATALAIYFGGRLISHRREKKYLLSVGAGAACNVIMNLFLMPSFGALAAAISTITSQLTVAGMANYFSLNLPRHRPVTAMITSSFVDRAKAFSYLIR
jgi:O-antigen/teichoic acid export membrane protein